MTHPFDEFSKSLSESVPRREMLRRFGAVVTGAVLGPLTLGLGSASADEFARERRKRYRRQTLNKLRLPLGPKPGANDACTNFCQRCRGKSKQSQCIAACRACNNDPSRLCGTCGSYTCTNLSSDPNCGACGNNCGAKGQRCCGGRCADVKTDPKNCGSCGHICGESTPNCINGTCTDTACPPGQTKCGTICTNLSSDTANCGACSNACAAGTSCVNGTCSSGGGDCPPGTDFMWDSANCGACGNVCPPQSGCSFGVCHGVCIDC